MLLLLCATLIAFAQANPVLINSPRQIRDDSVGYAVDFTEVATKSQFSCLGNGDYSVAFVRAYTPAGQGTFDGNSITNINNAYSANVATEVYITPQPMSTKSGATQLSETYNGLTRGGIRVRAIWLQVTTPSQWGSVASNIQFIQSFIDELSVLGLSGGIYTSSHDWNLITNNWTGASSLTLWYFHVNGNGLNNESAANYNDFVSFGGWYSPIAKQFAEGEAVCGVSPLNRDIYTPSNSAKLDVASAGPVVGGNI